MSTIRSEFGCARTICACAECAINCHFIPGYLIPADLERMAAQLGYDDLLEFAVNNLLASPGATVLEGGKSRRSFQPGARMALAYSWTARIAAQSMRFRHSDVPFLMCISAKRKQIGGVVTAFGKSRKPGAQVSFTRNFGCYSGRSP